MKLHTRDDIIHTVESAATLARVAPRDIRRWIDRDGLPARLVGNRGKRGPSHYRILESALLAWLARGEAEEPTPAPAAKLAAKVKGRGADVRLAHDPSDPMGFKRAGL